MLLLIDNYDSFTYNLHQYLAELGADVLVRRNDDITVERAEALTLSHIVISPGPRAPREAGVSRAIIARLGPRVPLLGVCLGHQCIGDIFGGRVVRAPEPVHGKVTSIRHSGAGVLRGLPNPFTATRYHSLIVERATLPPALEVTAETDDNLIMGLRHREYPIEGVQFHPESILTEAGKDLLRNFLGSSSPYPFPVRGEGEPDAEPDAEPEGGPGAGRRHRAHVGQESRCPQAAMPRPTIPLPAGRNASPDDPSPRRERGRGEDLPAQEIPV